MSDQPVKRKNKTQPRPYRKVCEVTHGEGLAEIVEYQSPFGARHHVFSLERCFEAMTTGKRETSKYILPDSAADLKAVIDKAEARCRELDGSGTHRGQNNGVAAAADIS